MRFSRVIPAVLVLASASALSAGPSAPPAPKDGLRALDAKDFVLAIDAAGDAVRACAVDELARRLPGASVRTVVASANREGHRSFFVLGIAPWNLRAAFSWQSDDAASHQWYPQGISAERDLVLVSWYQRHDEGETAKGVRVSFVDTSDLFRVRYRHALLVEPTLANGRADFRQVNIHAGGIARFGRWLYVPDTTHGFRIFDLEKLLEVETDRDDRIGFDAKGRAHAFGYRYVIPQTGAVSLAPGSAPARFSSVAVDRTTRPPTLVTCEYRKKDRGGPVLRFALDETTGRLEATAGVVRPVQAFQVPHNRVQGVLAHDGTWLLSCSSQNGRWGELYATAPGRPSRGRSWVTGAESLSLEPGTKRLWSLSEHPGERVVFAVALDAYD